MGRRHAHEFAVDAACEGCGMMLSEVVQAQHETIVDLRAEIDQAEARARELEAKLEQAERDRDNAYRAHFKAGYDALAGQLSQAEARARRLEEGLKAAQETCEYACDTKTSDEWCLLCRIVDAALKPPS